MRLSSCYQRRQWSIISICRNYLWDAKAISSRAPLVAWDIVCRPKREGGLVISECITWNDAALAKYLWNIAKKSDTLWVQWVNHIYLKDAKWWQYQPPQDCDWHLKKICTIKNNYSPGFIQKGWLQERNKYTVKKGYK